MELIKAATVMKENPLHQRKKHLEGFELGAAFSRGEYVPIQDATIPMTDMGFFHADAAYDVVSVSRGQFFRLGDHLDRMEKSCAKFYLESPYSRAETSEILHNLVKKTGLSDAYVWWAVTRGVPAGPRGDKAAQVPMFYAFALPYVWQIDQETLHKGIDLHVSSFMRIPTKSVDPTAKNFHWMDMKLSLFQAKEKGADWAVLMDRDGNLTEAPGCNVFLVKDGRVITPDSGCLEGVTRLSVMDLANQLELPLEVRQVKLDELMSADEAMLTSSAGGVMPVRSVGGKQFAENKPGPISVKLHNAYWEKRWNGWHGTPIAY